MRQILAVALLAVGCVTSERVLLERPADGARAECGGEKIPWGLAPLLPVGTWYVLYADGAAHVRTRTCVEDFQKAGYERAAVPPPIGAESAAGH